MRDSERYMQQAESVLRLAARASSPAERRVYETIAEGWRKLAGEARRNEQHDEPVSRIPPEMRPPRPFNRR
jgi:hypothetical protein